MEKLRVGDKVYFEQRSIWTKKVNYFFDEVVRLTKTQAVLSKGKKLINKPEKEWNRTDFGFCEYGNRYNKWFLQSDEVLEKAKIEHKRKVIESWFNSKKFTDEEKNIIYNHFNNK